MAKLALCIKTADAPVSVQNGYFETNPVLIPIEASFFSTPTQLVDRAICETDTSLLQLLPYIVLEAPDSSLFTYTRGGGGEEARLHGNYSVGVGGHVDNNVMSAEDDLRDLGFTNLLDLLIDEADREIEEEVSLCVDTSRLVLSHFIVDGTNPVGQVHLGLLCHYKMNETEYATVKNMILEDNVIVSGRFETLDSINDRASYDRLENWSKVVVDYISKVHTAAIVKEVFEETEVKDLNLDTFLYVPSDSPMLDAGTIHYPVAGLLVKGTEIPHEYVGGSDTLGATVSGGGNGAAYASASVSGCGNVAAQTINISAIPAFKQGITWFIDLEALRTLLRTHNIELTYNPSAASSATDTTGL